MKKNIAIPVAKNTEKSLRAAEREALNKADLITAVGKVSLLESVNAEIDAVLKDQEERRQGIISSGVSGKDSGLQIFDLNIEIDGKLSSLYEKRIDIDGRMTVEDRAARLIDIEAEDKLFDSSYHLQELSLDDKEQITADQLAHDEYVTKEKYKNDRVLEYPPIGEQLDAIWEGLASLALGNGLPDSSASMLNSLQAIKDKYPKPV